MMESEGALLDQANRRLGTVLCGKYTVNRVLGVGGMAVVYAATHRNQKQVAIKMLHPELSLHTEIRKRFLREGYVANSVKHKGAVDVIDDDVAADGAAFIVMEYLDGAALDAIADQRGGKLNPAAALVAVYELCAVLAAAHASEIVHRDVKPANIFVTTDGELKVLDFGIARLRDQSSGQATNTNMMLGTPAFMAPEQARGLTAEVGAATDIWAAGATLFTLLSGTNVHDADNAQMMMIQAATKPPRSLSSVMPELPAEVVRVVDKALMFERNDRWPTAAAMRAALREAHLAAYGELSVARTLAPLVGGTPPHASDAPREPSRSELASAPTVMNPMPPASSPAADARPAPVGATTAFPVTSSFVQPIASKKSIAIGVAVVALLGAGAVALMVNKTSDGQVAAGNALVPSMPIATTSASSAAAMPAASTTSTTGVKLTPLEATGSPSGSSASSASSASTPQGAKAGASPVAPNRNARVGASAASDPKAPVVMAPAPIAPTPAPPTPASAPPPRPPPPPLDPGSIR